ncbi:phage head closure protein [Hoeflea sp. EC-HK425]|uniref:phage head closure protein n=1 Tax=Hoeflea sp. EC-HK425 TaxID=2038388 RepID=UPI001259158D|nr:phage head closure protein [Hoeflea sp. EC-HK425]VVT18556.1 putative Phage head-tail adaptor, SPP1 family [Hoeflea sp. EC-HK425]|tara:strand:+ start:171 stop:506 length:336 start_codon:yes stop_codon:yes gene_type:complete
MAAMFIDPGRLSARLDLETPADLSDGQGGVTGGWTPVASVWARIEPLRAAPREEASAGTAPITHRVTIRYRDDVRHTMRFVHRGRELLIRAVRDPDESRRYLVCDCEENRP